MKKEMSIYEFCSKSKKMPTKELLCWLGIEMEYDVADLGDRYLRAIGDGNLLEFSCIKSDFDRWANSSADSYDLNIKSERRSFIRAIEKLQQND